LQDFGQINTLVGTFRISIPEYNNFNIINNQNNYNIELIQKSNGAIFDYISIHDIGFPNLFTSNWRGQFGIKNPNYIGCFPEPNTLKWTNHTRIIW